MKIPEWVPKEGADYLAWYHKLMTRRADSHPMDENVLRQKIQVLEKLAISDEIRTNAVEPLKQMGFTRWRDFYGAAVNACLAAISSMAYELNMPPNEYKAELNRFAATAKDLIARWERLNIGGLGYVENVPLEDGYWIAERLKQLATEIEAVSDVHLLFAGIRAGHHRNMARDEAAMAICTYLHEVTGRPRYRIVAAVLRASRIDCLASEDTVRSIWRRSYDLSGQNSQENG
ncbi:hypothetical protein MIN45_P0867 [Methylomarinovum tepidoasis]|uniref:Uncharacterized protein n=1 Tax=Methylomarinovum tepidoasis TaxID=2840183 RepID=A0AAU9BYA7_9GAMM|nr:hypothetical protein [Methylomarinovum sp. IN45]BCX88498.1 hypothetical protein MIN45_P0867 [Methylomarinovum sp. IN45]